jgi:S-adenosylmethionine:tRNA ribosyltransferase-isomerase
VLLAEQVDPADPSLWNALVRPAKKVVPGETLLFFAPGAAEAGGEPVLRAEVTSLGCYGERTVRFSPAEDFYETVSRIGHMPLPPYIRRDQAEEPDSDEDRERYQTVYAEQVGSAAAPTAGLHFTPEVLESVKARGVEIRTVTLHVGLGTFQPVRVENVEEVRLHAERYTLTADTAEAIRRALRDGRRIIAVGTTTTRTLEHVAAEALAAASDDWISAIQPHSGSTSIFIAPGHRFRVVSGLLTNFHLPESTLLMLVAAMAAPEGEPDLGRQRVLAAYRHAVAAGYRFYSYGDCMLMV